MGARLLREADLATTVGPYGPIAPNSYAIRLNPADLAELTVADRLNRELEAAIEDTAFDRGWRLEGPATVWLEADPSMGSGRMGLDTSVTPGERMPWAALVAKELRFPISINRSTVGRSETADVQIPVASVSRIHCLVWRESGQTWVADIGSSNGTMVNQADAREPRPVIHRDTVILGDTPYSYIEE